jgi:hypothetical protein
MNSQQDHEATPNKKMYRGSWLLEYKAQLKWASLAVLLLLLAWALPPVLSAYNATGQCLSRLSKLSESEMKLRVVKGVVAHYLEGAKPARLKIMFLGRSVTQQELIERNQSGTLLDLLKERPLPLSDEDQLNQFSAEIDKGEFTILFHTPETTYSLTLLPGKSLHRADPAITTEFFKTNKHLGLTGEKLNNFGNYLYQYEHYSLDTACCGARRPFDKEEIIDAKKRNIKEMNHRKRFPEHRWSFPISNCGAVWFPPPHSDNRTNFLFD